MEPVQSVAIAQPRQGVGDACGLQASRANLGILEMRVRVRATIRHIRQGRQGDFRYRAMSPARTYGKRIIAPLNLGISNEMRLNRVEWRDVDVWREVLEPRP